MHWPDSGDPAGMTEVKVHSHSHPFVRRDKKYYRVLFIRPLSNLEVVRHGECGPVEIVHGLVEQIF